MVSKRLKKLGDAAAFDLMMQNADKRAAVQRNIEAFALLSFRRVSAHRLQDYERLIKRFLRAGEQHPQPDTWPTLEEGSVAPDKTHLKFFATWLINACEGYIGPPILVEGQLRAPYITSRTLLGYIMTVVEALRRRGFIIGRLDVADVRRYCMSDALLDIASPTTAARPKYIATRIDLMQVLIAFFRTLTIKTPRMRAQLAFGTLVAALSSERPGAIWESSSHAGSNAALRYGDCEVFVMQNPECPDGPGIPVIRITINLLKGMRFEDSMFKTIFIYPEPDKDRIFCPVHLFLALALDDGAFADVQTIEEVLDVSQFPIHMRHLAWAPQWKTVPVMRAEIHTPEGGWSVSDQRALSANTVRQHLYVCSDEAGLENRITPYSLRRNAANIFAQEIDQHEREMLMGHTLDSKMFQTKYQSRTSHVDLGALHAGREQSLLRAALTGKIESMSRVILPNAPRVLTAQQRQEIAADPELKECDAAREKALAEADECRMALLLLVQSSAAGTAADEDGRIALQREKLETKRKEALAAAMRHKKNRQNLFKAEAKAVVKDARKQAFEEVTNGRQAPDQMDVTGVQSTIDIPEALRGAEDQIWKDRPPPLDLADVLKCTFAHPLERYLAIAASKGEYEGDQLSEAVEALLGLSEYTTVPTAAAYYPGEDPGSSPNCPFSTCGKLLHAFKEPGRHVHQCAHKAANASLQAQLAEGYAPRTCPMSQCRKKATPAAAVVYMTRNEFVDHVMTHLWSKSCQWQEGDELCGHHEPDWTVPQWARHLAEEHGVNVIKRPRVEFCFLCHEWFLDLDGTGNEWEAHLETHYEELFAASAERSTSTNSVFPPIAAPAPGGLLYLRRFHAVKDQRPILHGAEQKFITQRPWFCPECLFDESRPMATRMYQYRDVYTIRRHLCESHYKGLNPDTDLRLCPVPACGQELHTPVALMDHLVAVHAIPVLGALSQAHAHVPFTSSAPEARFPWASTVQEHEQEPDINDDGADDNTPSVAGQKRRAEGDENEPPLKRHHASNDADDDGEPTPVASSSTAPAGTKRRLQKRSCHRDAKRRRGQYGGVPEFWCLSCHIRRPVVLLRAHIQAKPWCSKVAICGDSPDRQEWERYSMEQYFEAFPQWLEAQVEPTSDAESSGDEDTYCDPAKAKALQWLRKNTRHDRVPKTWPKRPKDREGDQYPQARYRTSLSYRFEFPDATVAQFWLWVHTKAGRQRFLSECSTVETTPESAPVPPSA